MGLFATANAQIPPPDGAASTATLPDRDRTSSLVDQALKISGAKVLAVVAHPDDEAYFAASLYRITREFGGTADLIVITNGESGYRFSQFGAAVTGKTVNSGEDAKSVLPTIRQNELIAGGKILGIREHLLLNQQNAANTEGRDALSADYWNHDQVTTAIRTQLSRGGYDYLLTILPKPDEHAEHRAASVLALEAVQQMPEDKRPVVLGASLGEHCGEIPNSPRYGISPESFDALEAHPSTAVHKDVVALGFDRKQHFGCKNKLSYQVVANAHIAAHLSQGASQEFVWEAGCEKFFVYQLNNPENITKAETLVAALNEMPKVECLTETIR